MAFAIIITLFVCVPLGIDMGRKRFCGGFLGGVLCFALGPLGLLMLVSCPKRDGAPEVKPERPTLGNCDQMWGHGYE